MQTGGRGKERGRQKGNSDERGEIPKRRGKRRGLVKRTYQQAERSRCFPPERPVGLEMLRLVPGQGREVSRRKRQGRGKSKRKEEVLDGG